ncbi:MAG: S-layer homology domain-containing protein [Clostridiales bacterium]|nr:S-layer homology domain-containing protein [Clostridiales bacterium]
MKTSAFTKRICALFLAVVLVFSMSSQVFAAGYSDVPSDYWAEDYISKLSALGYFSGYEDGTFRPNGGITYIETLALLSRLYDLDETAIELMCSDYADAVAANLPSNLSWASSELCICMASGIISANELGKLTLTNPINKKDFALLLVRALQLDENISAANSVPLPFEDAASITGNYHGSVVILYNAKIVDGDENNRFNPTQTVTRAVASAMLYRTLDYIKTSGISLDIPGYKATTVDEGVISSVSGSVVRVKLIDGTYREYTIGSGKYYLNGTVSTPNTSHVGGYINLIITETGVRRADVYIAEDTTYVSGLIYSTSTTSNGIVNIVHTGETNSTRYLLAENAYVSLDGTKSEISSLSRNSYAFAKVVGGKITEIYASNYTTEIKGTITEVNYGTTIEMRVKDEAGGIWYFGFDIADLPEVYIANYEISIDRLEIGDKVTVTVKNGKPVKIVSEATQASIRGQITSMISTVDGLFWEITDDNGIVHRHSVASDAAVYKGTTSILLSTIKVGDLVSVSLFNSVITTVNLENTSTAVQTGKITGTVLNVDNNKREIILLISDKLFYVNVSGAAPIYNAVTGRSLGISQITPNSTIVAYGTYDNSVTLNSTLVVVEALA